MPLKKMNERDYFNPSTLEVDFTNSMKDHYEDGA